MDVVVRWRAPFCEPGPGFFDPLPPSRQLWKEDIKGSLPGPMIGILGGSTKKGQSFRLTCIEFEWTNLSYYSCLSTWIYIAFHRALGPRWLADKFAESQKIDLNLSQHCWFAEQFLPIGGICSCEIMKKFAVPSTDYAGVARGDKLSITTLADRRKVYFLKNLFFGCP